MVWMCTRCDTGAQDKKKNERKRKARTNVALSAALHAQADAQNITYTQKDPRTAGENRLGEEKHAKTEV